MRPLAAERLLCGLVGGTGRLAGFFGWGSFGLEEGYEVADLIGVEGVAEGGHFFAAFVDLVLDLVFGEASAY